MAEAKERNILICEVKAGGVSDEGHGSITGYGAVKHNVDSYGDIIVDGAFHALDVLVSDGFGGESHDWQFKNEIGTVKEAIEDEHGLKLTIDFYSTPDAQMVRQKVKERLERGKTIGLSIGYFVDEFATETRDGNEVRLLKKVTVFEVSVVAMPANPLARVTAVKGERAGVPRAKQLEEVQGMTSDYLTRVAEIGESRPDEWKASRAQELRDLASKFTGAADALTAPTLDAKASPAVVSRALQMAGLPE